MVGKGQGGASWVIYALKKKGGIFIFIFALLVCACQGMPASPAARFRMLSAAEYRKKMMAGWIGQMVGVSYGSSTEFRYINRIIPTDEIPALDAGIVNRAFNQDDLYVELTFLRTLEQYGFEVTPTQAGLDFARTEFPLWHANSAARLNLRSGIAPPDSGHPAFNFHADDIDYQIEADFAGLISPGMPNAAIQLGEIFGRMMNYGDGLYGGLFISCMYSEAFFEHDPQKLVMAGLACIPAKSQYAQAVRDVLAGWQKHPQDWQATWRIIQEKYQNNPAYRQYSCSDVFFDQDFNIDAKINGAYIVLGLLYGNGDPVLSMTIAMRAGQDSDCNPSSTGGVLSTVLGMNNLPEKFSQGLNINKKWAYSPYDLAAVIAVCEKLARQNIIRSGGRIEKDVNGEEIFIIPFQKVKPLRLEQSWQPGPIANSTYPNEVVTSIKSGSSRLAREVPTFSPGWRLMSCDEDDLMGSRETINGRPNVLLTKSGACMPCILANEVKILSARNNLLHMEISALDQQTWTLVVRVNGEEIHREVVNSPSWEETDVNLAKFSGKKIRLEVINLPDQSDGGYGLISNLSIR